MEILIPIIVFGAVIGAIVVGVATGKARPMEQKELSSSSGWALGESGIDEAGNPGF